MAVLLQEQQVGTEIHRRGRRQLGVGVILFSHKTISSCEASCGWPKQAVSFSRSRHQVPDANCSRRLTSRSGVTSWFTRKRGTECSFASSFTVKSGHANGARNEIVLPFCAMRVSSFAAQ